MIKDITQCLLLSFFIITSAYGQISQQEIIEQALSNQKRGFANLEHRELGDTVRLQWSGLGHGDKDNILTMPNGLRLSYGEIVYLAGDMIGDASCSISSEQPTERATCFLHQFHALAKANSPLTCESPVTRVPAYRQYFRQLTEEIEKANREGQDTTTFYHVHTKRITYDLNQLSCGGSFLSPLFPFGQYIKLAAVNFDHFPPDAITAYKTGHRVAIQTALKAHRLYQQNVIDKAEETLQLAYAQNAYANHYLSDAMSSGHMRVPRREIANQLFLPAVLNLLIANLMHDEDNRLGLHVHNRLGQHWRAYGDGMLHQPRASVHRQILITMMQESADGIFYAFSTGQPLSHDKELDLLPVYDEIGQNNNHAPLFKLENGHLLKRKNNFDPQDLNYTRWWSGLVTLVDFLRHNE